MIWERGTREAVSRSDDAALVEAARGAPAAFYQFRLSPSGQHSISFVSSAFADRFGVELGGPEEAIAAYFSRVHRDDLPGVKEAIARSARKLTTFEVEFRFRLPGGAEVWVEARAYPEPTPDGGVLWNGIATEITARKRAEEALRESEFRFRTLFQTTTFGVVSQDKEGKIVMVNPAAERILGVEGRTIRALTSDDVRWQSLNEDGSPAAGETHPASVALRTGQPVSAVVMGVWSPVRSGYVWLLVSAVPEFRQGEPGPAGVWVTFEDITERRRLEEQLLQARRMEAIGKLAGGVAHDFNNLLTVIAGNTDLLLLEKTAEDPQRGALRDIREASERAASLTRQLLAFSRQQVLEPRLVDVNVVITGIEKHLKSLIGEGIALTTELAADESWVKVDPGQLEQVVVNLVLNAREAMPRGGRITLQTRNLDAAELASHGEVGPREPRPKVAISIADTGAGIPPGLKAHLFEPFVTTKEFGKASGLGLASVHGIVKQSGGDITVESEPGSGCTFTVVFPTSPAPRPPGSSSVSRKVLPRGTETVLLVDDDDAVRRIMKITLEATGYRVIEARSGVQALEFARAHADAIHLVVTDVVMPGMDGRKMVEQIAKERPDVRILYVSGYTNDPLLRDGIAESRVAFLQKPFTPLVLASTVREVLDAPDLGPAH
jgi:two-component system cell cycle sensor histidine kinase/response regulator CckA